VRLQVQECDAMETTECDVDDEIKWKAGLRRKIFVFFFSAKAVGGTVPFGGEKQFNVSPTVTARQ
jgi:hypothetical protein